MKKILVADDDRVIAEALEEKLTQEGYQVLKATQGEEALKIAQEQKPDAILLDIVMPVMAGNEVLQKLKLEDTTKDIPVIILTNLPEDRKPDSVEKYPDVPYLVKVEHSLENVVTQLKQLLGES